MRPVKDIKGNGGASMADMAEIVSGNTTDIQSDFAGIDWNQNFLLLRHRVVELQLHLLRLHFLTITTTALRRSKK